MYPIKIQFVITGLDYAGAETQLRNVALTLAHRGHICSIVSLTKPNAYVEDLAAAGISVMSLEMTREAGVSAIFKALEGLRRHLRQAEPDVIHSHMVHANILARLARIGFRQVPLICTAHSVNEGGWIREAVYKMTNGLSTLNTTVSNEATRRFISKGIFPEAKTMTVYNGIRLDDFHLKERYESNKTFRWISVGRLEVAKDYPTLLHALAQIDGACLDIAGKGALQNDLMQLVQRLDLKRRVRFLGLQTDIPLLLPTYDGFVLSSAWEGFSLAVAEAMASGLPIVATQSGGPTEIVGADRAAGLLVPARSPVELANAMKEIAALSANERRRMGAIGRRRVAEKFSIDAITDQWESLYRSVLR